MYVKLCVVVLLAAVSAVGVPSVEPSEQRVAVGNAAVPTSAPTGAPASRPDMTAVLAANTVALRDVPYVVGGVERQRLDVYAPAGAVGAPVVVFVHGGEWARGDKGEVSCKPKFLNEHGVVFVAVNYRLSVTDRHPAQVEDVASAVRWVVDHAAEIGASPRKVVLMGHSAGCHLVTLATLDPKYLGGVGMAPTSLAGTVAWSGGAYDLVEKVNGGGMYPEFIRKNFGTTDAELRRASPMSHVGEASAPPILFCSAERGNAASRELSERFAKLVVARGGQASTLLLEGKTHVLANHECGAPGDVTGEGLLKFVREVTSAR
jgi:acetyl esterase/lipase